MDQNKTSIPHFPVLPKALASLHQLRTHIVRVIVHGKGTETYVAEGQRWPQDTNLTLTVLLKAIVKHKTTQDVLYLQMDNCCRENKNKWVLCFCFLLVKMKIFKKVRSQNIAYYFLNLFGFFITTAIYCDLMRACAIEAIQ